MTFATLAWVPVLAATLLVFVAVGVVAMLVTASVWVWRSVSPAQACGGSSDERSSSCAPESSRDLAVRAPGRRVVRDRTLGYDA